MMKRVCSAVILSLVLQTSVCAKSTDAQLTVEVLPRAGTSVAIGAQRVNMLTLQLTASCDRDIALTSIMLHHKGLGNSRDIERVYAVSNGVRRTRSVAVTGRYPAANLLFRGMRIPGCSTVKIDVLADISAEAVATGQHGFAILDAKDIATDPPVKISLGPVAAPALTTPVGTVTGSVSVDYLDLPSTLSYGSARTLARLRLRADNREDQAISSITFTNDGTATNADLQNLFLETSGHTRLSANVAALDGSRVRVDLSPVLILHRNEVRLVQLLGDVRASRRRTVRLIIQEPSDIEVTPVP